MEFVESDDGSPFRRPPALDDRIWRHPSEVGAAEATPKPPRLVPQHTVWLIALSAAIGASVLSTGLLLGVGAVRTRTHEATPTAVTLSGPPATAIEPFVAIAERVRPAITQIKVVRDGGRGSGSGVVFREDGHVLTNAHVIDGATSIQVVLSSGREVTGRVVGSDPVTDTAVVKIDGGPFAVAELGTAADLKVGQAAIAIGSPLALVGGPSVTVGVVSALHRSVKTRSDDSLFDMIQTDAPISPGSSGGALVDGKGRIIGVTTAIAVSDVGAEGLGFATPIDVARSIGDELIATGKATHAWIGIEGRDLDGAMAHDLSLDGGVMVSSVRPDEPAASAGMTARDVILSVDGRPVLTMGALVVSMRAYRPGDVVTIELMRDRQRISKRVALAERPANP